jgi:hypothetical protein
MSHATLNPGDKVVDLAGLARSSAMITGAITLPLALWVLEQNVVWIVSAVVAGAVIGFLLGALLGRTFLPTRDGQVLVIKLGPGALASALKASLNGGACTGILIGLLSPLFLSEVTKVTPLVGLGATIGIIWGSASAYIATRP